jgi:hypothetical protein
MMGQHLGYERAKQGARQAAHQHRPWIVPLGRLGFAAYGIVYTLVGVLAAMAALGLGGDVTDTSGALGWIVAAPLGRLLLGAIAVGLVGYALWRLLQAALDTEGHGADTKGMLTRAGYVIRGAIYAGLALTAAKLALASEASASGEERAQDWTARLLSQPWGALPLGLIGAGIVGVGLYQLYRAVTADFCEKLRLDELSPAQRQWVERLGRVGYAARGVVFGIIGGCLMVAAWHARADEARGVGGALATLAQQPAGPWLLALVAIGLIAYGLFKLIEARCRRLQVG